MKPYTTFFITALKAAIEYWPGNVTTLANKAGVPRNQVYDMLKDRKYGSEEVRRSLATALGWDSYDEFMRYGECLVNGQSYVPHTLEPPKLEKYISVNFHKKIKQTTGPSGNICFPDDSETNEPFLLPKNSLKKVQVKYLASFCMPDNSMHPLIAKGAYLIIDVSDREPKNGKIFLVADENNPSGISVRRVIFTGPDMPIFLMPINIQFTPSELRKPFETLVVGRLLWIGTPVE